jgi:hypothetical protein
MFCALAGQTADQGKCHSPTSRRREEVLPVIPAIWLK